MINLDNYFGTEDKILIVPNVMKSYFLEYRKLNPKTHFKLFSIDELFKELVGNYYSKDAIKFGLNYFKKYSYSSIKEINEVVFKSFKLENATLDLQNYEKALKENRFKVLNDDLILLLKSRNIIVVGLKESSTLKSLFNFLDIKDVLFLDAQDVIEINLNKIYWKFNDINEEVILALNNILFEVESRKDPSQVFVSLDVNRYEYYLETYLEGINVPYYIDTKNTLIDTKTFKYIYKYIKEDINIVEFLKNHKDDLLDDPNYDAILEILEFYEVDKLPQKKINIVEILKSQRQEDYEYSNDLRFSSSLYFSQLDSIFVLGFDHNYMPSSIKDTGLISYKVRENLGLDNFDETNLINVKLEEAFIKQSKVTCLFFHEKDNCGRNKESYFAKQLECIEPAQKDLYRGRELENGETVADVILYGKNLFKINYRGALDLYEKTNVPDIRVKYFFRFYEEKLLPLYSNNFVHFSNFELDKDIVYSYSSLDVFNKCPFEFYCKNILKIDEFEDNIYTKFGNIAHAILEKIYENCFVFDEIAQKEIEIYQEKNGKLTKKELALLPRFLMELKRTCDLILEHKKMSSIAKTYSENQFDISLNRKDYYFEEVDGELKKIPFEKKVEFTGRIDRIIETQDNSLFVIDYKTGDARFSKSAFLIYNLDGQLPAYIMLLDHTTNINFANKVVSGLFIQPLIIKNNKFYNYMKPSDEDLESIKLQGRFLDDIDRMRSFDNSLSEIPSPFVAGLKLNAKGNTISNRAKRAITNEEINKYREHYESILFKYSRMIEKGIFNIYPIQIRTSSNENACRYCSYRDICLANYEVKDFNE